MKKAAKLFFGIILFIVLLLAVIPIFFQDKLVGLVKQTVNNNINAQLEFSDADLSFFSNFPDASVTLEKVSIVNFEPFEGDTLFYSETLSLNLKLTELFKNANETLIINSFSVDDGFVSIRINEQGKANYDIGKTPAKDAELNTEERGSTFSVTSYAIRNTKIRYSDLTSKLLLKLNDFNHSGSGDFSANDAQFITKTASLMSLSMDSVTYIENQLLDLDATIHADLKRQKYTFLENEGHINQLPLIFDGSIKVNETSQELDINFKTPTSDFKNFLALIPKAYSKDIDAVKTTGDFTVMGKLSGVIDDAHIPKIDINIASNNASFKYPDLPKSVNNIHVNVSVKNTTGLAENTFIDIKNLAFKIDNNPFKTNALITNLTTNPSINGAMKCTLNLDDLSKVYPVTAANTMTGVIVADVSSSFDVAAIQNNIYQRIKSNGNVTVSDFNYNSKDVVNPIQIKNTTITFQPGIVNLTGFDATTGTTDLNATGTIDNLLGFLLSDKNLKGDFSLVSNRFSISDFMEKSEESTTETKAGALKIPAFLDCTINASAATVLYDNLELKDLKGTLILKDEKATFKSVSANVFGGNINVNGIVNTQPETPDFNVKLGVNAFDIAQSFNGLELFKSLSPIASILQGKINTTLDLKGDLKQNYTPNLTSMSGSALAQILTNKINPENSKALTLLNDKLSFIDLKELNLDDIKTSLSFDNGNVNVKPFSVKYKDIDIAIGGSHSFDQIMNYKITLDVPAKYLGKELKNLLSTVSPEDQKTTVPITANLSGSFSNPTVKTDLKDAIKTLTSKLIKNQKDKLVKNTLGTLLGSNSTKQDSIQPPKNTTEVVTDKVKDKVKDKVGSVLGGLFGNKKKDTIKND